MKENIINNLDESLKIICTLQDENADLRRQVEWLSRQLFGRKSEQLKPLDDATPDLFAAESSLVSQPEPEQESETVAEHKRKKRSKNGWNNLPKDLPREEVIIDVPEDERKGMVLIGYETSERFARRETCYFIKVVKRAKYADPKEATRGVVTAPPAGDFFDTVSGKTKFDASFVAGMVADKMENHLPLYRQSEILEREGILVNRSTLQHLFANAAEQLEVLYNRQNELISQCEIVHGDETPVRLLEPGSGKCRKAYMWVKMSGLGPPLINFHFANSRSKEVAEELYKDYYGTILRDNYAGYADLSAGHAGCWAHVRRKFFEAFHAGYTDAEAFLNTIRRLYMLERQARENSETKDSETALFQARKIARRLSKPLVVEFFKKCEASQNSEVPTTPLAKALNYALNQKDALEKFLSDPRLNIDNNPAENVIRPIALGRKNWLFAGSKEGGKDLAILASFSATCHRNNVNFRRWLEDILRKIGKCPTNEIDSLLPHLWNSTL